MPTDEWRRCGSWMNTRRPQLTFERSRGVLQRQRSSSLTPRRAQDEAMTALTPQTHGAPLENPVTDTHRQQSPRRRRYQ